MSVSPLVYSDWMYRTTTTISSTTSTAATVNYVVPSVYKYQPTPTTITTYGTDNPSYYLFFANSTAVTSNYISSRALTINQNLKNVTVETLTWQTSGNLETPNGFHASVYFTLSVDLDTQN